MVSFKKNHTEKARQQDEKRRSGSGVLEKVKISTGKREKLTEEV
jgi:hypothetical protein